MKNEFIEDEKEPDSPLPLLILLACHGKPRCSLELAKMLGKKRDERNILKYLNRMKKEGYLNFKGTGLSDLYSRSKYFITNEEMFKQHDLFGLYGAVRRWSFTIYPNENAIKLYKQISFNEFKFMGKIKFFEKVLEVFAKKSR